MNLLEASTTLIDAARQLPESRRLTSAIKRMEKRVEVLRLRQLKAIRRRRSMGWHIIRCLLCKHKHIGRGVVEAIGNPKCRKCRQEFDFGDFVKVVELTGRGRIKSLYCPNCDAHVMGDLKLDNYDPAE